MPKRPPTAKPAAQKQSRKHRTAVSYHTNADAAGADAYGDALDLYEAIAQGEQEPNTVTASLRTLRAAHMLATPFARPGGKLMAMRSRRKVTITADGGRLVAVDWGGRINHVYADAGRACALFLEFQRQAANLETDWSDEAAAVARDAIRALPPVKIVKAREDVDRNPSVYEDIVQSWSRGRKSNPAYDEVAPRVEALMGRIASVKSPEVGGDARTRGRQENSIAPPGTRWRDVRLKFVYGDAVRIVVSRPGEKPLEEMKHCAELGMATRNSKRPTVQWQLLQEFAAARNGEIAKRNMKSKRMAFDRARVRLNQILKETFGISADAIVPTDDRTGWRPAFTLEPESRM